MVARTGKKPPQHPSARAERSARLEGPTGAGKTEQRRTASEALVEAGASDGFDGLGAPALAETVRAQLRARQVPTQAEIALDAMETWGEFFAERQPNGPFTFSVDPAVANGANVRLKSGWLMRLHGLV